MEREPNPDTLISGQIEIYRFKNRKFKMFHSTSFNQSQIDYMLCLYIYCVLSVRALYIGESKISTEARDGLFIILLLHIRKCTNVKAMVVN